MKKVLKESMMVVTLIKRANKVGMANYSPPFKTNTCSTSTYTPRNYMTRTNCSKIIVPHILEGTSTKQGVLVELGVVGEGKDWEGEAAGVEERDGVLVTRECSSTHRQTTLHSAPMGGWSTASLASDATG